MYKYLLLLCLSFCCINPTQAQKISLKNLLIKQGDKTIVINKKTQHITLDRERFSIEFLNKPYDVEKKLFYAAQILVTTNDQIENNYQSMSLDEIPFFRPGTGMAAYPNKEHLFPYLIDEGHQYLYYASEKDFRVKKIGQKGKWTIFQWNMAGVNIEGQEILWKDYPYDKLTLYFIVDHNLNKVIDAKEHHLIHITFKN